MEADFEDALQYSWVPSTFTGEGAACPWDEVGACYDFPGSLLLNRFCQKNYVKKPAYAGIIEGFQKW